MERLFNLILIALIILNLFAMPAFAYVDPNAGSIVLQLIIGGITGILILLKVFWKKIRSFFNKQE